MSRTGNEKLKERELQIEGGSVRRNQEMQRRLAVHRVAGRQPAIRSLPAGNGWKENIERMMDECGMAL